jgi:phage host-nuclease inhibitor protein Gam
MANASPHTHPLLPWYTYDEISKLEIKQHGRKIDRFEGYETEEEIKRKLRLQNQYGEFEVVGVDMQGHWLPERGELIVAPRQPMMQSFLQSRYFSDPNQGRRDEEMQLQREREQQLADERRRAEDKQERLLDEQRRAEQRLLEQERELQRDLLEKERLTQENALQIMLETLREKKEVATAGQRDTVEALTRMFEEKSAAVQHMAESQQSTLAAINSQTVNALQREVDSWKSKYDDLRRDLERREDVFRDKEDRMRDKYESEMKRLEDRFENERSRVTDRYEGQLKDLEKDARSQIERLQEKVEDHRRANEDLRDRVRDLELETIRTTFETQAKIKDGPSQRVSDAVALMQAGKDLGVDPATVFKREMGYDDVEEKKPSVVEGILKEAGPFIKQALQTQVLRGMGGGGPPQSGSAGPTSGSMNELPSEEF